MSTRGQYSVILNGESFNFYNHYDNYIKDICGAVRLVSTIALATDVEELKETLSIMGADDFRKGFLDYDGQEYNFYIDVDHNLIKITNMRYNCDTGEDFSKLVYGGLIDDYIKIEMNKFIGDSIKKGEYDYGLSHFLNDNDLDLGNIHRLGFVKKFSKLPKDQQIKLFKEFCKVLYCGDVDMVRYLSTIHKNNIKYEFRKVLSTYKDKLLSNFVKDHAEKVSYNSELENELKIAILKLIQDL